MEDAETEPDESLVLKEDSFEGVEVEGDLKFSHEAHNLFTVIDLYNQLDIVWGRVLGK